MSDIPVVTGNEVVDKFLYELDVRCEGGRGTPSDSAARLKAMRPIIRGKLVLDPAGSEQTIREFTEQMGFDVDNNRYVDGRNGQDAES